MHHKAHAWLEGGPVNGQPAPSMKGWIAALDELGPLSTGHRRPMADAAISCQ